MASRPAIELGKVAAALNAGSLTEEQRRVIIRGIKYDSRQVGQDDLFVCIRGLKHDGHKFAEAAVQQGGEALVVERRLPIAKPQIIVPDARRALGLAAAELYSWPSRQMRVIGVTGTKGKTTTTYLIRVLLESIGKRVGLIGTIEQLVAERVRPASRTTPEASDIQALLHEMVEADCSACVMEVSSHAVSLQRTVGTEYDVAVFTNLARDHMDFHHSMQDYLAAKTAFFAQAGTPGEKGSKVAVVNLDDPHWSSFASVTKAPVVTYAIDSPADLRATDIQVHSHGTRFTLTGRFGSAQVALELNGLFNVYNALAALAVAVHEGLTLEQAVESLATVKGVPGRFERVDGNVDFTVIVDYAHTEESLRSVLRAARAITKGRILVVCGAGGDRDKGKRPLMGRAMAELADYTVITTDNPRSEDPKHICEQIEAGVIASGVTPDAYEVILDRRTAIQQVISMARPGDLVLIAGKGHETYQQFADHIDHFDDREEAAAVLAMLSRSEGGGV